VRGEGEAGDSRCSVCPPAPACTACPEKEKARCDATCGAAGRREKARSGMWRRLAEKRRHEAAAGHVAQAIDNKELSYPRLVALPCVYGWPRAFRVSSSTSSSMAGPWKRPAARLVCAPSKMASHTLRLPCSYRCFSVLGRPPPNYEGHIPLTRSERLALAVGSGLMSFLDPRRGGNASDAKLPAAHR
jgi:hypothetical protein